MKLINISFKKMLVAHSKFILYQDSVSEILRPKVQFNCSVVYHYGDGFCLYNEDDGIRLAPLDICIKIINEKGFLTTEDFDKNRI